MTAAAAALEPRFRVGRRTLVMLGALLVLLVVVLALGGGPAILDFLGWFVAFALANPSIIVGFAVPIGYGALCAAMNERSGVINIGVEGMLLTSAFVGFLTGAYLNPVVGQVPAALLGVVTAILASMILSALHAWLSITVKADQVISGTVINILAMGGTAYFNQLLISTASVTGAETLPRNFLSIPAEVFTVPLLGPLLRALIGQGPIQTSLIIAVVLLQVMLFRSRWGLRTRAVGEHPKAADTVGIDVYRVRYRNVILGGVFAGLGGAYLTLESVGSFQDGMTGGVGFIAIAALIFGRWTPIGALAAALIFGAARALQTAVQRDPPPGAVGDFLAGLPGSGEIYGMLPYVLTIVVLVGVVSRAAAPAAEGIPYDKEARA